MVRIVSGQGGSVAASNHWFERTAGQRCWPVLCAFPAPTTNKIVHFSEWCLLDKARPFFESPELIEIRRKVGVRAPDFLSL